MPASTWGGNGGRYSMHNCYNLRFCMFLQPNADFVSKVFCLTEVHFVGPLVPCVLNFNDSASHGFQSQGGSIVAHALLSLVHNDPLSHLWLPGLGSNPVYSPLTQKICQ